MLKSVRQKIITTLWKSYCRSTPQIQLIKAHARQLGIDEFIIDHFAVIDLPGPHTGINKLKPLFSAIGYKEQGKDYLASKQNDFLWMAEVDSHLLPAKAVLPQAVIADFRLEELPHNIKSIIQKYTHQAPAAPLAKVEELAKRTEQGDTDAAELLTTTIIDYLAGRDWPLPTVNEFYAVQQFNELLAWVLVFGRRPNHFTLSIHHLPLFADMMEFLHFIENKVQLELNYEGGKIKGGKTSGLSQSSTMGAPQTLQLSDGSITLPTGFVEFVWRYPRTACQPPTLWSDYFTGFIAQHADHVIESLYLDEKQDTLCKVQG